MVVRLTDLHVQVNFEFKGLFVFARVNLLLLLFLQAYLQWTDKVVEENGLRLRVPRVLIQTARVDVHFNILIIILKIGRAHV